jgi:hypothetical protein
MAVYNDGNKCVLNVNNITGQNVMNICLVLQAEIMETPALSLVCQEHLLLIHL